MVPHWCSQISRNLMECYPLNALELVAEEVPDLSKNEAMVVAAQILIQTKMKRKNPCEGKNPQLVVGHWKEMQLFSGRILIILSHF